MTTPKRAVSSAFFSIAKSIIISIADNQVAVTVDIGIIVTNNNVVISTGTGACSTKIIVA